MPFLLDLLLDGDTITTEMVMHYLLGNNRLYHRLDPSLPVSVALDDTSSSDMLRSFAQTVDITDTLKFIETNFTDDYMGVTRTSSSRQNKDQQSEDSRDTDEYDAGLVSYEGSGSVNSLDSSGPYHHAWLQSLYQPAVESLSNKGGNSSTNSSTINKETERASWASGVVAVAPLPLPLAVTVSSSCDVNTMINNIPSDSIANEIKVKAS